MFESGSNFQPHQTSYAKSRILDPIQNSTDLLVFRILELQHFHWILSCMRVRDWNLIKHIKLSMYLDVGGVDAWLLTLIELLFHELNKNVPFNQAKSLIKHGKFFLHYFNAWIRKFHQNCRVLTIVLEGPTSRFEVGARARA